MKKILVALSFLLALIGTAASAQMPIAPNQFQPRQNYTLSQSSSGTPYYTPTWIGATIVTSNTALTFSSPSMICVDTTAGPVTISLPPALDFGAQGTGVGGKQFAIKLIAGGNSVTINPNGTDTLDGTASQTIAVLQNVLWVETDGTTKVWRILNTGSGGGGGAVNSVSNADGSVTVAPTTGNVVVSLPTQGGLTPGAYTNVNATVNNKGVLTAIANGSGGGGGAPTTSKYLLQQPDGTLPNAQAMSALSNGLVKNATTTGIQSIATQGTDYYAPGGTDVAVTDGGLNTSTAPSSAQIPIAQSGSAYAPETVSGDGSLAANGALTVTKTNGVAFAPSATTDTTNAANISSGALPAGRMPGLTGDVTSSAGSVATTIANSAVTNAKMANMVAHTYKGNNTGSTAAPADVTTTQLTADLNVFTSSLKGLAPASGGSTGTHYLDDTGAYTVPAGGGGGGQASVEPAATENPHRSVIQFRYNIDTTAFISMGTGSAAIGTFNSGTPATLLSNGVDSNGCFGLMGSGATSGNAYGMASGSGDECQYQTGPKYWIHFKTITSTNVRYVIGLGAHIADIAGNNPPASTGVGAWIIFDTSSGWTTWHLTTCNGSAVSTVTDTGVTFVAGDTTAMFDLTSPSAISARINGGSATTNSTAGSLPPATTSIGPFAVATNLASTSAQIKVASGWLTQN